MDFIKLGLDVSSFNKSKQDRLIKFIELFEKLEKFDGKIFNPMIGSGINEFNNSIRETNSMLNTLSKNINSVKSSYSGFSTQSANFASAVKKAKEEQDKLTQSVNNTSSAASNLSKNASSSASSLSSIGKSLSTGLGYLRTIAYILPGIGIAGIFNVIGDSVLSFANQLGIAESENEKLSKSINESIGIVNDLEKAYSTLADAAIKYVNVISGADDTFFQSFDSKSQQFYDNISSEKQARGFDKNILFADKLLELGKKINNFREANGMNGWLFDSGKSISDFTSEIEKSVSVMSSYKQNIDYYSNLLSYKGKSGVDNPDADRYSKSELETMIKDNQKLLDLEKSKYDKNIEIVKEYRSIESSIRQEENKKKKFEEDQQRLKDLETAKSEISLNIEKNNYILKSDKSSYYEKLSALRNNFLNEKNKIIAEDSDVQNNLSNTRIEKDLSTFKSNNKISELRIKQKEAEDKLYEEYRQRHLKAISDIDKAELEKLAEKNQRIFNDERQNLEDRLDSLSKYVSQKQEIQRIEFNKDKEAAKLKAGGAVPKEEMEALVKQRDEQISNINASSQEKAYNIVNTYFQLQLNRLKDFNRLQERENKDLYAKELTELNKSYENKIFRLRRYYASRELLDDKYSVSGLEASIVDDKQELKRIRESLSEQESLMKDYSDEVRKSLLEIESLKESNDEKAKSDADKKYDIAVGKEKALSDAIVQMKKTEQIAKEKLDEDELKLAKRKYEILERFQKEHNSNIKKLEEALLNIVKEAGDKYYERQINRIALNKQSTDEQYGYEIDAIRNSTLESEDKFAKETQLKEQQRELDREFDLQKRKMEYEKAIFDRDITIAKILWNTQESISAALTIPPPLGEILAVERAALGAAEIAAVMIASIPSYADGVDFHEGGYARYGEAGAEVVKEPGKSPYLVLEETIGYLPRGTQVVPVSDIPDFNITSNQKDGWEQFKWLAKKLKPKETNIVNNINVYSSFTRFRDKILR